MKKLFFALITLACAASCSKETIEEGAWSPEAPYTTSMEVAVAGDSSRAFDENLNWSWEADDALFSCQVADQLYPNTLTLKENGKFGTDQYQFATTEVAPFFFAYPAASIDPAQLTITAPQTGTWSPVLCATTPATTVEQLQQIELTHLSSAYEVRVWEAGRSARKVITKAVLSSESDFVASWQADFTTQSVQQQLSGKELIVEQEGETVVFNLGEGTFDFTLTLTDTEGNTLIVPASQQALSAGKRTVLNVEWKSLTMTGVTSWYEQYNAAGSSSLAGSTIYLEGFSAAGGKVEALLDGQVVALEGNTIKNVASGAHTVQVRIAGSNLATTEYPVTVTMIPELNYLIHSSYNSSNGSISKSNNYDGRTIYLKNVSLNDPYFTSLSSTPKFTCADQTVEVAYGSADKSFSELALKSYNCYGTATITFPSGKTLQLGGTGHSIAVTGIPYDLNPAANDSWNAWKSSGNVSWNEGGTLRLGYNLSNWFASETASVEKSFYLPADTAITIASTGTYVSSGTSRTPVTFTLYISGNEAAQTASTTSTTAKSYSLNATKTMSASNATIKCTNYKSTATSCTKISTLTLRY